MENLKIKSVIIILLSILAINFFDPVLGNAQQPTFEVKIRNCDLYPNIERDQDSILTFDIYLQHTNLGISGPFILASHQYFFNFNPGVANGGTLTYRIVPGFSQLRPDEIPINPQIVGNILYLGSNNEPVIPDTISSVFPGTRVVRMELRTSARLFALQNLAMEIRTGPAIPYTKVFSYIGTVGTEITNNGTYIVEPGFCLNNTLPVELASFTSSVNGNNVTLNWTTTSETNNSGFDIERKSVIIKGWTKVGNVAGYGNTNEPQNYTFSEKINTGKYNYRLKQIDFNGNFVYFQLSNEVIVGVPEKYNMSQNYPNPFNPTTNIIFDIPKLSKVELKIYDIAGREIAVLVDKVLEPGSHTYKFDGSTFASGVYFYRIKAADRSPSSGQSAVGEFVQTKRMILIK